MLRWENYFLKSGDDFGKFWKSYQHDVQPDILFIMGVGFDPRTLMAIEEIFSFKTSKKRDTVVIRYFKNEEETEEAPKPSVAKHLERLGAFLKTNGHSNFTIKKLVMRSDDDKSIASVKSTNIITNESFFDGYSDVVIDISAMPRSVFIPVINKALTLIDRYNKSNAQRKNLHIVVSENSKLDSIINDRGTDEESSFIHGFYLKQIALTDEQKEVWIPILGEKQLGQFDKIRGKLNPVEICPVLPFPSENLRRGDNLIVEYQDRLFNGSDFEAKNIVYVDESNPFQVYRLVSQTIKRYNDSFALLKGCKIIVSALSSKLLTMGTFLAVFEKKSENTNIGIMHVESLGHDLDPTYDDEKISIDKHNKMFEIWLTGEPYND
ncbi:hypothetical protein [Mucilaginibacter pedocola]|uniref:Uncharacterized protein n=1 Tax=Mucilaginibacter pedocola TaxID=1792845 RepID=A0A1S9PLT4_9SPHI|nr:hypothetical protein [Mucilaginibacter pedocola]OOQ61920.1 hypothetical protein BC343_02335 [Mucilaginibacter pedocola]